MIRVSSMSETGGEDGGRTEARIAAAEYLVITASRLSRMAAANGFPLLAHLLDQAVLEAWEVASKSNRRLRSGTRARRASPADANPGIIEAKPADPDAALCDRQDQAPEE